MGHDRPQLEEQLAELKTELALAEEALAAGEDPTIRDDGSSRLSIAAMRRFIARWEDELRAEPELPAE
jgi:hypothetical protein